MAAVASSRSDSFTRSSFRPRMRVMPSAKAAATARIGYSSIMVGARSAGTSTPLRPPRPDPQVGDVLTALVALLQHLDRGAHLAQRREQPRAQRIGHHAIEDDFGARHDQRGHQRERGRRRIGRHHHRRSLKLRLAVQRDAPAMARRPTRPSGSAPKCFSIFSVWSRVASCSIRPWCPGAARPASSTADLSCAEGTGASYSIGIGSLAPRSVIGSRPPSADIGGARAHLLQRIEDAAHRARAQAGVAVKHGLDRAAGDRPHDQAAAGPGIAEIERRGRLARSRRRRRPATRQAPALRSAPPSRPVPAWPCRC